MNRPATADEITALQKRFPKHNLLNVCVVDGHLSCTLVRREEKRSYPGGSFRGGRKAIETHRNTTLMMRENE